MIDALTSTEDDHVATHRAAAADGAVIISQSSRGSDDCRGLPLNAVDDDCVPLMATVIRYR